MFELLNVPVLDEAIKNKKVINFTHNPVGDEGFLGMELKHLQKNNYIYDPKSTTAFPN